MRATEILKAPFNGILSNSKLKMKESIIVNFILASVIGLALIFNIKNIASHLTGGYIFSGLKMMGMGSKVDEVFTNGFVLIFIDFIAITLIFSAIIYVIGKEIFKLNISYEECVSTVTYANIIPAGIFLIGTLFSIFIISLDILAIIIGITALIILTYEGLSNLFIMGKSKLIYSITFTYIINLFIFFEANQMIIKSMLKSGFNNLY